VSREQLSAAVEAVDATTRPAVDTHLDDLLARYSLVRRFLPALLATLRLQAAPAGTDVLAAWEALRALEGRRTVRAEEAPLTLATGPWAGRVVGPGRPAAPSRLHLPGPGAAPRGAAAPGRLRTDQPPLGRPTGPAAASPTSSSSRPPCSPSSG